MHSPMQHAPPSAWIDQHIRLVNRQPRVLDLACGGGRHTRLCLRLGCAVTAVDRNIDAIADLATNPMATLIQADLEHGPWPLAGQQFGAVIVCNYLHRPLFPCIFASVAPGGLLLYDTFAAGNEHFGQPRNPDFLLRPDELQERLPDNFTVLAYRHGQVDTPKPAMRQSLCARRNPAI